MPISRFLASIHGYPFLVALRRECSYALRRPRNETQDVVAGISTTNLLGAAIKRT